MLINPNLFQEIYHIWVKYPYIFGEAFCVIRGLAAETSANATVLTITAFTVERFKNYTDFQNVHIVFPSIFIPIVCFRFVAIVYPLKR